MKNKLNLAFIFILFIAFNINAFAQQQLGVKVNGGLSKITNSFEDPNATVTPYYAPSGQIGFYYNLSLGKRSSLGTELLFSQIEGKEKLEMELIHPEVNNLGHYTSLAYRHISYLSLPVYYGCTIKRLTIHGGFQVSYVLSSNGREENNLTFYGFPYPETHKYTEKIDDINIERWDFGPRAGITYQLTNQLAIEATYYYGLNNIQKGDMPIMELKTQQMTVGIRYALWNKEASK